MSEPVTIEDGCKKCGEKRHSLTITDGTPQPEPFNPLINMTLVCKGCGLVTEHKDTYIEGHSMDMGPDVVIEEIPISRILQPPYEEKDLADLRRAMGPMKCAVCGKGTVLGVCTECRLKNERK